MPKASEKRTDWELVEAIRAGSHHAFALIVERYSRQVANLVYLSLGNRLDAEDLTQEVFFRFYQSIERLSQRDSVFPWIYRIAANLCIDESRKRSIRRVLSLDFLIDEGIQGAWLEDTSPKPDRVLEDAEERDRIHRALGRLPAQGRLVVVMRDFEGLSYGEMADVLGWSIPTVKTRLFRSRQRLAKLLAPGKSSDR